jgi:hypothetical protein
MTPVIARKRRTGSLIIPLLSRGRARYGIPYLAPEVVLTLKSVSERDNDEHDFSPALPLLDHALRDWLQDVITRRWDGFRPGPAIRSRPPPTTPGVRG